MGEKVLRLAQKLGHEEVGLVSITITVPPHWRVKNGKREDVDGYTKEIEVDATGKPRAVLQYVEKVALREAQKPNSTTRPVQNDDASLVARSLRVSTTRGVSGISRMVEKGQYKEAIRELERVKMRMGASAYRPASPAEKRRVVTAIRDLERLLRKLETE